MNTTAKHNISDTVKWVVSDRYGLHLYIGTVTELATEANGNHYRVAVIEEQGTTNRIYSRPRPHVVHASLLHAA